MQVSRVGVRQRAPLVLAVILSLGACSPAVNFAGLKTEARGARFRERILAQTLPNGLRIVMVPDERSNLVMVGVHYAVGSSDDPSGAEGLAHYAEHVMFDAAYRRPGGDALRDVGLAKNADTTYDRTFFYLEALDVELDPSIEVTARRFEATCADLDPATLARERDVVIEEEKLHSSRSESLRSMLKVIWGAAHPYGHSPGGHGFAELPRPAFCKFIEDHYGPASAVVVVVGNVHDADFQRMRDRFARIPARPAATRTVQRAASPTARIVMNDLEHPTALLVFPAPGKGTEADAALAALDGHVWQLGSGAPARAAVTLVVGEERERAIVAIAEVDDVSRLDELADAMRRSLAKTEIEGLEFGRYQQHQRAMLATRLDDPFADAELLAAEVARGQRPTRFRDLEQLARLRPADLVRWFQLGKERAAFLLPRVGTHGTHHAADVATLLHELETPRSVATGDLLASLPAARPHLTVVEHRLQNGLRVLLAPDPQAVAMDARLMIEGTHDATASGLARDAAASLDFPGDLTGSELRRVTWYSTVGTSVVGRAEEDTTLFAIRGLALYADWHVWNLAWTVLHGTYGEGRLKLARYEAAHARPKPPTSMAVVSRRLAGVRELPDGKSVVPSAGDLEAFRRARYRPQRSTLIVSGDFDAAAMEKEIETLFGGWARGDDAAVAMKPPSVGTAVAIEAADEPTLELTLAFAAETGAGAGGHVPVADVAARAVLEELVETRMRVVRERLGASYGIHAFRSDRALWITGAVEPAFAGQAAKAIADELALIRSGDPSLADDFLRAKRQMLAEALAMPVGASTRADAIMRAIHTGGDMTQLDQQVDALRTLELATVQALAARALQPTRMITAVRGEKQAAEAALAGLGIAPATWEWLAPAGKGSGRGPGAPAEPPRLTLRTPPAGRSLPAGAAAR